MTLAEINPHYSRLRGDYLFSEIARRREAFLNEHPNARVISLGIGDVTRPLPDAAARAMHETVDELTRTDKFRGYGPEQGYAFLREAIARHDYRARGMNIHPDEIFISDGSKCDIANFQELFSPDAVIAVQDPVYPVYVETNVLAGRAGEWDERQNRYNGIVCLTCAKENGFAPSLPAGRVDLIYLCCPNNPTGAVLTREQLKKWVDYAKNNDTVILYDAAYEAFIREADVPRSIYEIEGAREVAVEFRSFSKTAGFTGVRCAYVVVPRDVKARDADGGSAPLADLWRRRQAVKFNGVSYITQRGAAALYTPEGRAQIAALTEYYMANAKLIREGLQAIGIEAFGGVNAPYIWLKTPAGLDSWSFFDKLLREAHIVGTPGSGFGRAGEGYFRLSAFAGREETEEAVRRLAKLRL